ncbi:MAG: RsmD family RNA methyltransferase, partial [Comamonas sp.]
AEVLLVEHDGVLAQQITRLAERLQARGVTVRRGDGVAQLAQREGAGLDLVLLDPPFDAQALFIPALRAAARAVAPSGRIYLEAPRRWSQEQLAPLGLTCQRYLKAGASHAHLLGRLFEGS